MSNENELKVKLGTAIEKGDKKAVIDLLSAGVNPDIDILKDGQI